VTTNSTPEQFLAALTDYERDCAQIFGNSADEYLKVHGQGPGEADVTGGSHAPGNACTTTVQTPTASY